MTPAVDREGASRIPEDVENALQRCVGASMASTTGLGEDVTRAGQRVTELRTAIARALDAERERAAMVCDERAAWWRKQRDEAEEREKPKRIGVYVAHERPERFRYSEMCAARAEEDADRANAIRALARQGTGGA